MRRRRQTVRGLGVGGVVRGSVGGGVVHGELTRPVLCHVGQRALRVRVARLPGRRGQALPAARDQGRLFDAPRGPPRRPHMGPRWAAPRRPSPGPALPPGGPPAVRRVLLGPARDAGAYGARGALEGASHRPRRGRRGLAYRRAAPRGAVLRVALSAPQARGVLGARGGRPAVCRVARRAPPRARSGSPLPEHRRVLVEQPTGSRRRPGLGLGVLPLGPEEKARCQGGVQGRAAGAAPRAGVTSSRGSEK
mmetsp:Transcript_43959/g.99325  ORF Transcript_43959/g.99325 Transcript_43959/m.99325 type:complete len:250 (+) Transcript_43959:705-1454(+)